MSGWYDLLTTYQTNRDVERLERIGPPDICPHHAVILMYGPHGDRLCPEGSPECGFYRWPRDGGSGPWPTPRTLLLWG